MAKEPIKKTAKKAVKKVAAKKVAVKKVAAKKAAVQNIVAERATAPAKTVAPAKKTAAPAKKAAAKKVAPVKKAPLKKAGTKVAAKKVVNKLTTIVANIDVGFGNSLSLRGEGAGLSWDKGIVMGCAGPDEWVWSSDEVKGSLEFKMLKNDDVWAEGANLTVKAGERIVVEPNF